MDQFAALGPVISALLRAYPEQLSPQTLSKEAYEWAVQLWYAYAMQARTL